ncbi:MAG: GxxExxY protein [Candidatus Liptonbacteria bacterium]
MNSNTANRGKILKPDQLIYPELSCRICGLCFKVQNELGRFRNEKQYADFLEKLLKESGFSYRRELRIEPSFPGEEAGRSIADFVVEDKIVLELKTKRLVSREDYFQVKRYLISSGLKLGILVNFRQKVLTPKRILG